MRFYWKMIWMGSFPGTMNSICGPDICEILLEDDMDA